MDAGKKPLSSLQQRNISELARGAVEGLVNFNLADLLLTSKGESKAADKALQAEIETLRQEIALLNGTEHGVCQSLQAAHT